MTAGFGRDASVLGMSGALTATMNLAQSAFTARVLGPEMFGVTALVVNYPSVLLGLVALRSYELSVKYVGEFRTQRDKNRVLAACKLGYVVDLVVALISLGLVAATVSWAERTIVRVPGTAPLILLYAVALVPSALAGPSAAILMTFDRFRHQALAEIIGAFAGTASVVGLLLAGWGIVAVVVGVAIGRAGQGLLSAVLAWRTLDTTYGASWWSASLRDLNQQGREILHFLTYNNARGLIGLSTKQLDLTLVGLVRGPQEAGLYRLAKTAGGMLGYAIGPLQAAAFPRLIRAAADESNRESNDLVRRLTLLVALPLALGALVLIPFVPAAVRIIVGDAFGKAAIGAQVFLVYGAASVLVFWLGGLYVSKNGVKAWTVASAIAAAASIAGGWMMLRAFGFLGLVWTFCLVNTITYSVLFWRARERYLRVILPAARTAPSEPT